MFSRTIGAFAFLFLLNGLVGLDAGDKPPAGIQPGEIRPGESEEQAEAFGDHRDLRKLAQSLASNRSQSTDVLTYRCQHTEPATLSALLQKFASAGGKVAAGSDEGLVIVTDRRQNLERIKKIIEAVDIPSPQVLLQVHMLEAPASFDVETRLSSVMTDAAAKRHYTVRRYVGEKKTRFADQVEAWVQERKVQVLSAPRLIIGRRARSTVHVGQKLPLPLGPQGQLVYTPVGIQLTVTPTMIGQEVVRLSVSPEVTRIAVGSERGEAPVLDSHSVTTEMVMKEGQLTSLSGLFLNGAGEQKQLIVFFSLEVIGAKASPKKP